MADDNQYMTPAIKKQDVLNPSSVPANNLIQNQ
jgi:hypothetical protein